MTAGRPLGGASWTGKKNSRYFLIHSLIRELNSLIGFEKFPACFLGGDIWLVYNPQ